MVEGAAAPLPAALLVVPRFLFRDVNSTKRL
jgi:hypothetical protein